MLIGELRALMVGIPWQWREVILGNVVVGNFSWQCALEIANALRKQCEGMQLELPYA